MITFSTRPTARWLAAAALLSLSTSWAAAPRESAEATYRQDRAACLDSGSQHERSSCLREAGAARAQALRGLTLRGDAPETLARNALQRCATLPPDHQAVCERRVRGEGSSSGSVAGGGVLRELVIEVDGAAPPAAPVPPAPAR